MKKISLLITLFLILYNFVGAQNVKVMPVSTSNMSASAASTLYNRLNQAVTLNGMALTENADRFLLVPDVTVLSINATPTAPVKYVAEVEVSLFFVDNIERMILSQVILTKKGVAENETKAVNEAVKSIKSRDSKLKKMIVNGKKKMMECCDADKNETLDTLRVENEIPDVSWINE